MFLLTFWGNAQERKKYKSLVEVQEASSLHLKNLQFHTQFFPKNEQLSVSKVDCHWKISKSTNSPEKYSSFKCMVE